MYPFVWVKKRHLLYASLKVPANYGVFYPRGNVDYIIVDQNAKYAGHPGSQTYHPWFFMAAALLGWGTTRRWQDPYLFDMSLSE